MFEDSLSLIDFGSKLQVFYYGCFVALGLILLLASTYLLRKRRGISGDTVLLFGVTALPLTLICSRLLFCALDFNFHSVFSLRAVLSFWGGGFSMVGALLGFALAAFIIGRKQNICSLKIMDTAIIGVLLFMACERLGEPYTELLGRSRPLVSMLSKTASSLSAMNTIPTCAPMPCRPYPASSSPLSSLYLAKRNARTATCC